MLFIALALGCQSETLVVLQDAQNYSYNSAIAAPYTVVPARTDLTVDWSGLHRDLLDNPMEPTTDVATVSLVQFPEMTEDEVLQGINDDTLLQSDLSGFADYPVVAGETSAMTTQFSLMGYAVNPEANLVEGGGTYLVSAVTGESQYRMFTFFRPVEGAQPATVALTSDSATLSFQASLTGGQTPDMPASGRIRVDWSELSLNGAGLPIDLPDVDTLTLARYEESLAGLEADFLHVDALAEQRWTAEVDGWGDWYLDDLEDADGNEFQAFDEPGTWLLALQCSSCLNPAPPFLTVLQTP